MEIGIWRNLPEEIAVIVIARLLPRRRLVKLRTAWKLWNEMLSSYAAMQKIYPNIHLSYNTSFLFQFAKFGSDKVQSWVMEGNGDVYKVPFVKSNEYSYYIEFACNTMFCLSTGSRFSICDERSRAWKPLQLLPYPDELPYNLGFIGKAYESSTNQFVIVMGDMEYMIDVYDSLSDSWNRIHLDTEDLGGLSAFGRGVYYRGRFYWLDHRFQKGIVLELNLSKRCWTQILPPSDAIVRDYDPYKLFIEEYDEFCDEIWYTRAQWSCSTLYWDLAASDGHLILVDKGRGFMWKLENGDENMNSKRWCRVDISLPKEIDQISVNSSGWTVVVGEEINVYDGSNRLVRKIAMDDVDPQLRIQIKKHGMRYMDLSSAYLSPFECTYLWWPWQQKFLT